MKNKLLSLTLLALTLLGSCSSKVLSKEEYITLGKQITSEFKAPTAKSYKANFQGYFKNLWDSENYPCSWKGDVMTIKESEDADAGYEAQSALFSVPTKINTDEFEETYDTLNSSLASTSAKVGNINYMKVSKTDEGGLLFATENVSMTLFFYGLKSDKIQKQTKATKCIAHWTVYVAYDNTGCIKYEQAFINQTYTSDREANGDIKATYTLSDE